jgi:hypothetical protein
MMNLLSAFDLSTKFFCQYLSICSECSYWHFIFQHLGASFYISFPFISSTSSPSQFSAVQSSSSSVALSSSSKSHIHACSTGTPYFVLRRRQRASFLPLHFQTRYLTDFHLRRGRSWQWLPHACKISQHTLGTFFDVRFDKGYIRVTIDLSLGECCYVVVDR